MRQYRAGDLNRVVKSERADELGRGAANVGHPSREFGPCLDLDICREFLQYVVEQRDLFGGIAACAGDEKIGDALEDA